jgi:hypothetical protein
MKGYFVPVLFILSASALMTRQVRGDCAKYDECYENPKCKMPEDIPKPWYVHYAHCLVIVIG